ncbi:hypothetical protein KIPB_014667, partial [Kipferlia bialata]|eukprot:g14667.t1
MPLGRSPFIERTHTSNPDIHHTGHADFGGNAGHNTIVLVGEEYKRPPRVYVERLTRIEGGRESHLVETEEITMPGPGAGTPPKHLFSVANGSTLYAFAEDIVQDTFCKTALDTQSPVPVEVVAPLPKTEGWVTWSFTLRDKCYIVANLSVFGVRDMAWFRDKCPDMVLPVGYGRPTTWCFDPEKESEGWVPLAWETPRLVHANM